MAAFLHSSFSVNHFRGESMIAVKNVCAMATSIFLGFTLVGCKSSLSGVSSVDESLKTASADLASSASLTKSPSDEIPQPAACKTAKKIALPMTTVDAGKAVFRTPERALLAPAGVSISHYSQAADTSDMVAVNKKGHYGNVAFPASNGRMTYLPQLIMEGSCEDYKFSRDSFQNMLSIESQECGRAATLIVNGGSGTSPTAVYFNDGFVYLRYDAYTGNSNLDNRWHQYILGGNGKMTDIKDNSKVEIVCQKFDAAAKKRMDAVQFQHFGQYK
jgi:hypothetical protein